MNDTLPSPSPNQGPSRSQDRGPRTKDQGPSLKHRSEYLALRFYAACLRVLPYRATLAVGWLNAWCAFHVFRYRVSDARARIREVFEEKLSRREIDAIAWQSWRNIVFSGIEMLKLPRMTRSWIHSVSDCQHAVDVLKGHSAAGKGGIIAVPHMGSWEMAAMTCRVNDIPVFGIVGQQRNPLTNAYINRLRGAGMETIQRGSGTMRRVLQFLRDGRMLAILPDVRMRTPGLAIPFLGSTANIGPGMAAFARAAGVPIFPCIVTRHGWMRHRVVIHNAIWPDPTLDKDADVLRMTRAVMAIIEEAIRRDPGQWFWFNKRWILEPL